jgi:hypothetical protein
MAMKTQFWTGAAVGAVVAMALGLAWGDLAMGKGVGPAVPTIDDIVGKWNDTETYVAYDLSTGESDNLKEVGTYTITKTGDNTVHLHHSGPGGIWDKDAYYEGGVLLLGGGDDESSWTECDFVKGKAGHLSAKGQGLSWGVDGDYLAINTNTFKQVN